MVQNRLPITVHTERLVDIFHLVTLICGCYRQSHWNSFLHQVVNFDWNINKAVLRKDEKVYDGFHIKQLSHLQTNFNAFQADDFWKNIVEQVNLLALRSLTKRNCISAWTSLVYQLLKKYILKCVDYIGCLDIDQFDNDSFWHNLTQFQTNLLDGNEFSDFPSQIL